MTAERAQKRKTHGQKIGEMSAGKPTDPLEQLAADWGQQLAAYTVRQSRPRADGQLYPSFPGLYRWQVAIHLVLDALNGKQLWSMAGEERGSTQYGDYDQKLKETPPILQKIVKEWWNSGPNLQKFRQSNPKLSADIDFFWKRTPVELFWGDSGNIGFVHTVMDVPTGKPYWEAVRFFLLLITNPNSNNLAGPCARCGKYYLKKRASQKVYCSRRCGNAATAMARTQDRRQKDHEDKLHRANNAAKEWTRTRTKLAWKQWVSIQEPDITPKFLTRAVNKGEITPPTKGR